MDQQSGGLLSDQPHGQNHSHPQFADWGWFLKTYPRVRILTVAIVQGLVQDLNTYTIHGVWFSQWNLTITDAFKTQWVCSFLPLARQTNKQITTGTTYTGLSFPQHNIKGLLLLIQTRLGPFPKKAHTTSENDTSPSTSSHMDASHS